MALVREGELRKAWDRVREVGGSIHTYSGYNLTASPDGWFGFANHANLLCGPDADNVQGIVDELMQIADDAENIRRLNEPMLSVPACSKPRITIKSGCKVVVAWKPYNGDEDGCEER